MKSTLPLWLCGVLSIVGSRADGQLLNDGATNVLSHTTNITGDVTVGTNGAFTLLILSGQAVLTNSGDAIISRNTSARSNEVRLVSPSARWLVTSNLLVGNNGSFSRLVVSNGALVRNASSEIGRGGSSNLVLVAGAGSEWTNATDLLIGRSGSGNLLVVSNAATVRCGRALLSISSSTSNNAATVTGPGSLWTIGHLNVGEDGRGNSLMVRDGGLVQCAAGYLGASPSSRDNVAIVTGPGAVWALSSEMSVGHQGPANLLVISNGGAVSAGNFVRLGALPTSVTNRILIDGGSLAVTNTFSLGTGTLDVRRGRVVLNAGRVEANHLILTNAQGFLEFNGGTLALRNSTFANGQMLRIGDGVRPATLHLAGHGQHGFTGVLAVVISANALFTGGGFVDNAVLQFAAGSELAPGTPLGKFTLTRSPTLQGTVSMDLSKTASNSTNDQIQVTGPLTYGGALSVTHLGPNALAAGDRFRLFIASSYSEAFGTVSLPSLGPGLIWNNRLAEDGSIEVVAESVVTPVLTIAPGGAGQIRLSWEPPTPGMVLQESLEVLGTTWTNAPSGPTNPITLPATGTARFFRLFKL